MHLLSFGLGGLGKALFPGPANLCFSLGCCANVHFSSTGSDSPRQSQRALPWCPHRTETCISLGGRSQALRSLPAPAQPGPGEEGRTQDPRLGKERHRKQMTAQAAAPPPSSRLVRGGTAGHTADTTVPGGARAELPASAHSTVLDIQWSFKAAPGDLGSLGWGAWTRPKATLQGKGMTDEELTFLRW